MLPLAPPGDDGAEGIVGEWEPLGELLRHRPRRPLVHGPEKMAQLMGQAVYGGLEVLPGHDDEGGRLGGEQGGVDGGVGQGADEHDDVGLDLVPDPVQIVQVPVPLPDQALQIQQALLGREGNGPDPGYLQPHARAAAGEYRLGLQ